MRPIAKRETEITAKAVALAGLPDESVRAIYEYREPRYSGRRSDPIEKKAARRVLVLRGYEFDRQTGRIVGAPRTPAIPYRPFEESA